ncbi:hypothetical protein DDZ18_00555 [Marinicauda salina]|jgi:hypothetical protein|uniref:Uncharacterized protein n=1 Tax=Marinicauda salina TaxID=2135793 RepID=A0A2U2BVW9_9PROT|nr:hypothetical protein DDZ18_00555 [Marinicauda salina]
MAPPAAGRHMGVDDGPAPGARVRDGRKIEMARYLSLSLAAAFFIATTAIAACVGAGGVYISTVS